VLIKNRGHNFGWVRHLVLSIICGAVMAYKVTETDVLAIWRGNSVEGCRQAPLLTSCSHEASLFNCQMTECYRSRHRVETYRAVTDRCKHCGSLRFHVPTFFRWPGKKWSTARAQQV
jgi:hypothetical protein